jgi:cysteine-rich repeat protein
VSGARARQGGALLAVLAIAGLAIAGCGRVGYDADAASTMDAHALDATGLDAPSLEVGALDASLDALPIDALPIDASLDAREASVDMRDATSVDGGDDIVCGDGIVEAFEVCDDANTSAGDGCEACLPSPGFLCVGEPSRCTSRCGDGVLAPSEQCDDGDLEPGDGCAAGCTIEAGFACNRGQAPYFAFRQGRTDCVETTSPTERCSSPKTRPFACVTSEALIDTVVGGGWPWRASPHTSTTARGRRWRARRSWRLPAHARPMTRSLARRRSTTPRAQAHET